MEASQNSTGPDQPLGTGGTHTYAAHAGSAQSIEPLQSSSIPFVHISGPAGVHASIGPPSLVASALLVASASLGTSASFGESGASVRTAASWAASAGAVSYESPSLPGLASRLSMSASCTTSASCTSPRTIASPRTGSPPPASVLLSTAASQSCEQSPLVKSFKPEIAAHAHRTPATVAATGIAANNRTY